jgi:hypothetical protein
VSAEERSELESLATVVVPEDEVLERLGSVLAKIFPSYEIEEANR